MGNRQSLATGVERRRAIVATVTDYWKDYAASPSLREIALAVGVSSKNAVKEHIDQLVADGILQRDERGQVQPPLVST